MRLPHHSKKRKMSPSSWGRRLSEHILSGFLALVPHLPSICEDDGYRNLPSQAFTSKVIRSPSESSLSHLLARWDRRLGKSPFPGRRWLWPLGWSFLDFPSTWKRVSRRSPSWSIPASAPASTCTVSDRPSVALENCPSILEVEEGPKSRIDEDRQERAEKMFLEHLRSYWTQFHPRLIITRDTSCLSYHLNLRLSIVFHLIYTYDLTIYQSINQSNNQSMNWFFSQSIDQSIYQSINLSINQSINQSIN